MSQLSLDLPLAALRFDQLAMTGSNDTAFSVLRDWRSWPRPVMCLVAPAEGGLTTAARAWALDAGASFFLASQFDGLEAAELDDLLGEAVVIDRAERLQNHDLLLSLIVQAHAHEGRVLLTSRTPPANWEAATGDLRSRLNTMPVAEILPPDEDMVRARLRSAARLRYLRLEDRTIEYVARRIETSYAAIEDFVRRLDAFVGETKSPPTIPTARLVLDQGQIKYPAG